jgi:hypothetical protein
MKEEIRNPWKQLSEIDFKKYRRSRQDAGVENPLDKLGWKEVVKTQWADSAEDHADGTDVPFQAADGTPWSWQLWMMRGEQEPSSGISGPGKYVVDLENDTLVTCAVQRARGKLAAIVQEAEAEPWEEENDGFWGVPSIEEEWQDRAESESKESWAEAIHVFAKAVIDAVRPLEGTAKVRVCELQGKAPPAVGSNFFDAVTTMPARTWESLWLEKLSRTDEGWLEEDLWKDSDRNSFLTGSNVVAADVYSRIDPNQFADSDESAM